MTDYYLVSLLAAVMSVLFFAIILRVTIKHGLIVLFFPPIFLFTFFLLFFLIPTSIALLFQDTLIYRYQGGYEPSSWMSAVIFAFLFVFIAGLVSMRVTPLSTFKQSAMGIQQRFDKWQLGRNNRVDVPYMIVFYIVPVISLIFLLVTFGGSNYEDYMVNRTMERSGMGYIIMPSTWLGISLAAALFSAVVHPRMRWKLIVIIPFLLSFIYAQLFLGSKSRGLIVLVYAGLTWAFFSTLKSRFPLKVVVRLSSLAVFVSIVGLFFGDVREATTRQASLTEVETRVAVSAIFSKFNPFGAIENTVWLIENLRFDNVIGGRSFAAVFVGAVPRTIWRGKPVGGGPEMRNLISPGSYDINDGFQLSSYSPGIIAESYMNFGYFGFIVVAPIFGFAFAILARFLRKVDTPLLLVLYIILLYRMVYMLTGEVFGSVSGMFMILFPVLLYTGLRRAFSARRLHAGTAWKNAATGTAIECKGSQVTI